tara:strand:- start:13031 stop:13306 length:276 start_codon:yes stop_codon:yes gene_type:complete
MADKLEDYSSNKLSEQTKLHLTNIKKFVDGTINDVVVNDFNSNDDKVRYLVSSLIRLHDFVTSQFTEDSVKSIVREYSKENIEESKIINNE